MGKQRDQRGCSVSVFVSRARGPPRRVLDSRERQCRARVHPIEEDPLRPNRKTRCAICSSLVVNHFSPSAFSRRLVAGKSWFSFVPLPSTQTSEHKRCCTLLVRVPPRSRGSKCLGGRGFFVRFGDTTRTAAASLLSAERLLSHGGAHLVSSPRSHLRATTGQDGKSTEPPSHGASAFPPLWGQNFARESG